MELQEKYGGLCRKIVRYVLDDERDIEECVNDVFLRIWGSIPPQNPKSLSAYLARVSRNVALDKYSYNTAEKRRSDLSCAFEEIEPFLLSANSTENVVDEKEFSRFINRFLRSQSKEARAFFVRRYWYGESIKDIASAFDCSENKVKTSLSRTRAKLRAEMQKEGIGL